MADLRAALAVVRLVEDGLLEFGASARSLLGDDLPLIGADVTVEHLLSHGHPPTRVHPVSASPSTTPAMSYSRCWPNAQPGSRSPMSFKRQVSSAPA